MTKTAVILFNLGGPDCPEAVQPFLFNLFFDRAIIDLPLIPRWLLAKRISGKRAPVAREIYAKLGGSSPLLAETEAQGRALEMALGPEYRTFIAMRYWQPDTFSAIQAVKSWNPDRVVLLPLYPHFSTATTGSSIKEWHKQAKRVGLVKPTAQVCCYPDGDGWISALCDLISRERRTMAGQDPMPRVLFSAHGLPKSLVEKGDPYEVHITLTVKAVTERLGLAEADWGLCYQSRVGRQVWLGPSIDDALEQAAKDRRSVLVVPVSFVSEHSETLVELDMEYRHRAKELGVPAYGRVPTVGCHPDFIASLARLVRDVPAPEACGRCRWTCPAGAP